MNENSVEQVPADVSAVVLRLLDGWRPSGPSLRPPTQFLWAGEDMSSQAREVVINGDILEVRTEDVLERFFDHERRGALRNKPFEGTLDDGSNFAADSAHLEMDRASGHYWTVTHPERPARLWVAPVHGVDSLWGAGNLSVTRTETGADGSRTVRNSHQHHRFEGAYTYYLIKAGVTDDEAAWFILVDTGGTAPPTRDQVYPDTLALQFVLGRGFHFEVLYGVDATHQVVALVGGSHGRDHGKRGQTQAPVPHDLCVEHWPSLLFTAISEEYRRRPNLRLYIALSYYLDALVSFHVENRYLVLHVALEGLSYWLLGGDDGAEQPLVDKSKWRGWLKERQTEIMGLAVEGQETALFNKITSVPKRRASSRVVQDAFASSGIGLHLTDEMALELDEDGRGLIVHAAVMFKESQDEVDAYTRRIALVRTMLVALVARIVGYRGAITGWDREPGRPYGEPDPGWWPINDAARVAARRRYSVTNASPVVV